jgi:hypothetical protein
MNAEPLLNKIASAISEHKIETVMIGNAAAALQGAPVTTMDFDFLIRMTKINIEKIKCIAHSLDATLVVVKENDVIRLINEDEGIIIDFINENYPPGIKSFASLRSRAESLKLGDSTLMIASLEDLLKNKEKLGRPKDMAVIDLLRDTLNEQNRIKE